MARYRYRPHAVDAMYFDGTEARAVEIMTWLQEAAPGLTVRRRVEYDGWEDRVGHVELEIRDHEDQLAVDDWIVLDPRRAPLTVQVLSNTEFQRMFQPDDH